MKEGLDTLPPNASIIVAALLFMPAPQSRPGGNGLPEAPSRAHALSPEATRRFLTEMKQKLGALKTLKADFIQQRRMSAFMDTLTATGTCYFRSPDRIRWELKEPYHSALVFSEGKVAKFLFDNDRARKLNPASGEIMAEVLKMISLWMRGDFESSESLFNLQVERRPAVHVRLTPRSDTIRHVVHWVELTRDVDSPRFHTIQVAPYGPARILEGDSVAHFPREYDPAGQLDPLARAILAEVLALIPLWAHGVWESSTVPTPSFDKEVKRGSDFVIHLTPRASQMNEAIRGIDLKVDGDSSHIKSVLIHEKRGDQIEITFVNEKFNIKLDDSLFALD